MKCGSSVCGSNMVEAAVWKIFPFNFLSSNDFFLSNFQSTATSNLLDLFWNQPVTVVRFRPQTVWVKGYRDSTTTYCLVQYSTISYTILYYTVWYIVIQHCRIMYIIVQYYTVLKLNHMIQHVVYMRYCNTYKVYWSSLEWQIKDSRLRHCWPAQPSIPKIRQLEGRL